MTTRQLYSFEYERRARVGIVGCGDHATRNILPALQHAPIDLVAACDLNLARAEAVGRQFGAARFYTDFVAMIEQERLEAVYMVVWVREGDRYTGPSPYPELARRAMEAGAHVWLERPAAETVAQATAMVEVSQRTGRYLCVAYKRMFQPTLLKARELMASSAFGEVSALHYEYRGAVLPEASATTRDKTHPFGLVYGLMGPAETLYVERHPRTGAASIAFRFASGALGNVFFPGRASPTGPGERAIVVGDGAHLQIDNVIRLTYYRRQTRPSIYGRDPSFIGPDEDAPIYWEPEFSLGQMYNKNIFLMGYVGEVCDFAECVLAGRPPERGGQAAFLEIMRWTEAVHQPAGTLTRIGRQA